MIFWCCTSFHSSAKCTRRASEDARHHPSASYSASIVLYDRYGIRATFSRNLPPRVPRVSPPRALLLLVVVVVVAVALGGGGGARGGARGTRSAGWGGSRRERRSPSRETCTGPARPRARVSARHLTANGQDRSRLDKIGLDGSRSGATMMMGDGFVVSSPRTIACMSQGEGQGYRRAMDRENSREGVWVLPSARRSRPPPAPAAAQIVRLRALTVRDARGRVRVRMPGWVRRGAPFRVRSPAGPCAVPPGATLRPSQECMNALQKLHVYCASS